MYALVYLSSAENPLLQCLHAGTVGKSVGYGLFRKALEGQCSLVSALSPQYTQYILLLRRKTTCGSIKGLPQNLLKLNSLSVFLSTYPIPFLAYRA